MEQNATNRSVAVRADAFFLIEPGKPEQNGRRERCTKRSNPRPQHRPKPIRGASSSASIVFARSSTTSVRTKRSDRPAGPTLHSISAALSRAARGSGVSARPRGAPGAQQRLDQMAGRTRVPQRNLNRQGGRGVGNRQQRRRTALRSGSARSYRCD